MSNKVLKINAADNVLVALMDLEKEEIVYLNGEHFKVAEFIPAKHKFAIHRIEDKGALIMYGVLVGLANGVIHPGQLLTVKNVKHAAASFDVALREIEWKQPDVNRWLGKTFNGFYRSDGSVGTANYWLVISMVFCQNRNVDVLKEALLKPLGYGSSNAHELKVKYLVDKIKQNDDLTNISYPMDESALISPADKVFSNVDGIKFLTHNGGCGGIRQDAASLCGLIAGYITHSNVAGATILSLGCENAELSILQEEIAKRDPAFTKPLYVLEQQKIGTESQLVDNAIQQTLIGLMQANQNVRKPAPLNKLVIGLECGGSDGFSGISANPAVGYTSDLLVALGGSVILSEFPELCGVEQNLIDRTVHESDALRFSELMSTYSRRAVEAGSGFDMNPSPGNIRDGLITDAMKSAGAARKGGSSPITAVLDYPEKVVKPGLNLLCTPGNDVESTTAEVGSGANIVLFTTGLGTPTGNPIAPVVKIASNTKLSEKMSDIIDINTGTIIDGAEDIDQAGERILDYLIKVASGDVIVSTVRNKQDDFIPWKRGISL